MKVKVFCQDCKWRRPMWFSDDRCKHPLNRSQFVRKNVTTMSPCKIFNANGDCKKYQRKWWKIYAPLKYEENMEKER